MNPSQAQTLYIAHLLLYFNAAFALLFSLGALSPIGLAIIAGSAAGGYGIANERKWGYYLALVVAVLGLVGPALTLAGNITYIFNLAFLISVVFPVALMALLVHPQSRDYQRIWFH